MRHIINILSVLSAVALGMGSVTAQATSTGTSSLTTLSVETSSSTDSINIMSSCTATDCTSTITSTVMETATTSEYRVSTTSTSSQPASVTPSDTYSSLSSYTGSQPLNSLSSAATESVMADACSLHMTRVHAKASKTMTGRHFVTTVPSNKHSRYKSHSHSHSSWTHGLQPSSHCHDDASVHPKPTSASPSSLTSYHDKQTNNEKTKSHCKEEKKTSEYRSFTTYIRSWSAGGLGDGDQHSTAKATSSTISQGS